ncbi:MAG: MBL fold metallo-hydrolase [Pseudomonas sp.]|nr:MBL fold metallo-hydrolase [Pseudomonas sp.]
MKVAERWFMRESIGDGITRIWEPHVSRLFQCNMWHVRGRDADLLIDAGMGISSLRQAMADLMDKPVIALATHTHMDHAGSLHEFEQRLVHPCEAHQLEHPDAFPVLCSNHWPGDMKALIQAQGYEVPDLLIEAYPFEGFEPEAFRTPACTATGVVEEGQLIDLGDRVFEVLHLPGHSPGSIGLWDKATGTLFSGDAVYDGPLLDNLPDADIGAYIKTMERLQTLPVNVVHAGHDPSFDRQRLCELTGAYLAYRR